MSGASTTGTTLGVVGGGQLGRFFVEAAHALGYRTAVLDPDPWCPAAAHADEHHCAGYDDAHAIERFGRACRAATVEFENLPVASLERLSALTTVRPSPTAVGTAADRIAEKHFVRSTGAQVAAFEVVQSPTDVQRIERAGSLEDHPVRAALLKTARLGYDGKGQQRIESVAALGAAWTRFGGVPCVLEEMIPLDREFSIVLARTAAGECVFFPPTVNEHVNGILDSSVVVPEEPLRSEACDVAAAIAAALDYCGVLAVEFFVSSGQLLVNELAPRPHNSGHWTLDGAATSQFEQQVRALAGLTLGPVDVRYGGIAMVNLLGDLWTSGEPRWTLAEGVAGAHLHLYGKREARPGRKMGHITVVRDDPRDALRAARALRAALVER